MSEKRFMLIEGKLGTYSNVWDSEKQCKVGVGDELWIGEVVGLLNSLNEENEQLREDYSALMRTLLYFIKDDENREGINQVLEENKKLKEVVINMDDEKVEDGFEHNNYDYTLLNTYYEARENKIIEWNKHSSNAEYFNNDLEGIAELLNIKQMKLEGIANYDMKVGGLLDKIENLEKSNEELKKILKDVENEKKHYVNLYNECRRKKVSSEEIKRVYADLQKQGQKKLLVTITPTFYGWKSKVEEI